MWRAVALINVACLSGTVGGSAAAAVVISDADMTFVHLCADLHAIDCCSPQERPSKQAY